MGLAPVTTGLGEIYHYTIRAKKGYEDKYSLTDLRTMQDWIVQAALRHGGHSRSKRMGRIREAV